MRVITLVAFAIVAAAAIQQCEPVFTDPKPPVWYSDSFCNAPERSDVTLTVAHGAIPEWFRGALFRNVPAQYNIGVDQVQHWFDGFAQINAIDFVSNTSAVLRSKFLNSTMINIMNNTDKRLSARGAYTYPFPGPLFGNATAPAHGPAHKGLYGNNDVSVLEFGGRFFATTDEDKYVEFDPITLETISPDGMVFVDHLGSPRVSLGVTHGITDNHRGEYINYAMNPVPTAFGGNATFTFWKMDREHAAAEPEWNRTRIGNEFGLPNANYAHSFGATDDWIVWPENPVKVDAMADALGIPPLRAMVSTVDTTKSRLHLINRHTGEHQIAEVPEKIGLVMHSGNAYQDDDGSIVYDAAMYTKPQVYDALAFKPFLSGRPTNESSLDTGLLVRCRAWLATDGSTDARASCTPLLETLQAFPWINKRFYARKHRWVYTTNVMIDGRAGALHKSDMTTNQTVATWTRPISRPPADVPRDAAVADDLFVFTEAIFAPRQPNWPLPADLDPAEEEDGLLLTMLYHGATRRTVVVGVDPRTMESAFEVWLPFAIPPNFHGIFCKPASNGKFTDCLWN